MKIIKKIKKNFWFYIIQLFIIIISLLIIDYNVFNNIDLEIYWNFIEKRNFIYEKIDKNFKINLEKITIIWIDEKFFNNESISIQWLHRWYYSKVIDNINKYNPNTIWIDVLFESPFNFSENDRRSITLNQIFKLFDEDLAKSLSDKIVLASMYSSNMNTFIKPNDIFLQNNPWIWHINSEIYKRYDIWIKTFIKDYNIKPFSVEIFHKYKKKLLESNYWKWIEVDINIYENKNFFNIWNLNIPTIKNEFWDKFIFTPLYKTNHNDFNYISFYDILKNDNDYSSKIENKIVFIWAIDPSLQDIKPSLIWQTPWVLYHANQVLSFLNNDHIYVLDKRNTYFLIFFILIINIFILLIYKNKWSQKFVFILFISEIILLVFLWYIFSILSITSNKYNISIFLPIWTIIWIIFLQLIFTSIYYIIEVRNLKENFQKLLNLYVWKNISSKSKEDNISIKQAKEWNIWIYFSDIEWFTNISEKLTPEETIEFLNIYLEKMSENLSINNWFIDKYIWDSVMAFWEWENACDNAAKSSILNIKSINDINNIINKKLKLNINLKTRIWLHYWNAIIWDIWSENYKLNYTIIWDNVNLWSRLEWINKYYWTNICASENFIKQINSNEIIYRKLDKIRVKWKWKSVVIYEIMPYFRSLISNEQKNIINNFIKLFENWIEEYFKWNFNIAINLFKEAYLLKSDETCNIFIKRCEKLLSSNLINWDWIWDFKDK